MTLGALISDFCIRLGKSPGFTALYRAISSESYDQGKPCEASEFPEGEKKKEKKNHTGTGMWLICT